ncbi:MAG: hypothetical protein RTU92_01080 [Candidatus Thorarchaeota archaeon]
MEPLIESVLNKIFYSQDPREAQRDPNKLADNAYFNAQSKIRKQAYANWYKSGGEQLVAHMEENLVGMIKTFVGTPIDAKSPYLQQHIWDLIDFIDTIHKAFEDEKVNST